MKVFRLEQIVCLGQKGHDGSYATSVRFCGVFSSVGNAERTMRSIVAKEGSEGRIGYWLFEHSVDGGFVGPFKVLCQYDSVRAYLADGSKLCESLYDEACVRHFKWRDPASLKLKIGDVALWVGRQSADPILIGGCPPDKAFYERVRANAKRRGRMPRCPQWDYSDDCYYAYGYGKAHEHPPVWSVFPHFGKLSKRNLARLMATKKWYDEDFKS